MKTSALIVTLALCSCAIEADPDFELGSSTEGELGVGRFSVSGIKCLLSCEMRPLMTGTRERVVFDAPDLPPGVSAEVSPAGVVSIGEVGDEAYGAVVELTAIAAGDARLVVRSPSGKVIDKIGVSVRDAAEIGFDAGPDHEGPVVLARDGGGATVLVMVRDAAGAVLHSAAGVRVALPDFETVSFGPAIVRELEIDLAPLATVAAGQTTLTATAGDLTAAIDVIVE
jgi:hypothetical protein